MFIDTQIMIQATRNLSVIAGKQLTINEVYRQALKLSNKDRNRNTIDIIKDWSKLNSKQPC